MCPWRFVCVVRTSAWHNFGENLTNQRPWIRKSQQQQSCWIYGLLTSTIDSVRPWKPFPLQDTLHWENLQCRAWTNSPPSPGQGTCISKRGVCSLLDLAWSRDRKGRDSQLEDFDHCSFVTAEEYYIVLFYAKNIKIEVDSLSLSVFSLVDWE